MGLVGKRCPNGWSQPDEVESIVLEPPGDVRSMIKLRDDVAESRQTT